MVAYNYKGTISYTFSELSASNPFAIPAPFSLSAYGSNFAGASVGPINQAMTSGPNPPLADTATLGVDFNYSIALDPNTYAVSGAILPDSYAGLDEVFNLEYDVQWFNNNATTLDYWYLEVTIKEPPQNTWNQIDTRSPTVMTAGDFDGSGSAQLVASYAGDGTYSYSGGTWIKIDAGVPNLLASGDLSGSGHSQLVGVFAGYGAYTYSGGIGWTKIDNGTPNVMTVGKFGASSTEQLAGSFAGYGTYTWNNGSGWHKIDNGTPASLVAGDFSGLGYDQLMGVFAGYGTYSWESNTGWGCVSVVVYTIISRVTSTLIEARIGLTAVLRTDLHNSDIRIP